MNLQVGYTIARSCIVFVEVFWFNLKGKPQKGTAVYLHHSPSWPIISLLNGRGENRNERAILSDVFPTELRLNPRV